MKEEAALKKQRELEEEARKREEELRSARNQPVEGEEGDREGFSLEVYRYIKLNKELRIIADVANESLYSIRT